MKNQWKRVTITKPEGIGTLTQESDGRWSIELHGKSYGDCYYTCEQVRWIVEKAQKDGHKVEIS